jgi:hypothetical protein
MSGHVARMGWIKNICKMLFQKPEEKRPLGRPRRRWGDIIIMALRKIYGKFCTPVWPLTEPCCNNF